MNISEKNIKTLEDNLDLIFDRPPPAHRPPTAHRPPAHRPPPTALSTQHSALRACFQYGDRSQFFIGNPAGKFHVRYAEQWDN